MLLYPRNHRIPRKKDTKKYIGAKTLLQTGETSEHKAEFEHSRSFSIIWYQIKILYTFSGVYA